METKNQLTKTSQAKSQINSDCLIKESSQAKIQVITFIQQCFSAQKTYGKTSEDLESIMYIMLEVLADYSFAQVRQAFIQHMKSSPEIPTPHCIIQIIAKNNPIQRKKISEEQLIACLAMERDKFPESMNYGDLMKLKAWEEKNGKAEWHIVDGITQLKTGDKQ